VKKLGDLAVLGRSLGRCYRKDLMVGSGQD